MRPARPCARRDAPRWPRLRRAVWPRRARGGGRGRRGLARLQIERRDGAGEIAFEHLVVHGDLCLAARLMNLLHTACDSTDWPNRCCRRSCPGRPGSFRSCARFLQCGGQAFLGSLVAQIALELGEQETGQERIDVMADFALDLRIAHLGDVQRIAVGRFDRFANQGNRLGDVGGIRSAGGRVAGAHQGQRGDAGTAQVDRVADIAAFDASAILRVLAPTAPLTPAAVGLLLRNQIAESVLRRFGQGLDIGTLNSCRCFRFGHGRRAFGMRRAQQQGDDSQQCDERRCAGWVGSAWRISWFREIGL